MKRHFFPDQPLEVIHSCNLTSSFSQNFFIMKKKKVMSRLVNNRKQGQQTTGARLRMSQGCKKTLVRSTLLILKRLAFSVSLHAANLIAISFISKRKEKYGFYKIYKLNRHFCNEFVFLFFDPFHDLDYRR